jgi:hypothetical protein
MTRRAVDTSTVPLFDRVDAGPQLPETGLTTSQRRTARKALKIKVGEHPLTGLPLDPLAPRGIDRPKRRYEAHTCGSCVHLYQIPEIVTSALACDMTTTPRVARRWWPSCILFRPLNGPRDEAGSDDSTASQ